MSSTTGAVAEGGDEGRGGGGSGGQPQQQQQQDRAAQDFALMVSGLLQQMQGRFEQMSNTILSKIDEMDRRLDDLEGTMYNLAAQSGVSLPAPPAQQGSASSSGSSALQQEPHNAGPVPRRDAP